jgi:hypothetical protein
MVRCASRCWKAKSNELRRRDAERTAELAARERRIRLLEEALRILQADRYGASREKLHVAPGQSELFNEAETIAELNEALGAEVNLKATPQREDKPARASRPVAKPSPPIWFACRSCTICPRASGSVRAAARSSRSGARSRSSSTTCRRRSRCCSTCARSTPARAASSA